MTSRRLIPMLTLVVAALGTPPAAQAAWSPPQSVSSAANDVFNSTLAFGADGRALATWSPATYTNGHFVSGTTQSATRAPGVVTWSAQRSTPVFVAGPVRYAQTRAVGLDERHGSWNRCGRQIDLRVRFGRSDGTFPQPAPTIASYRGPGGDGDPALGANAAGQVSVAWVQANAACDRAIVRIAHRCGGGTGAFTAPETLRGRGRSGRPSVTVGQGGDVVVAWARRLGESRTAIEARYRRAGGGWSSVQKLGEGTVAGPLRTAMLQNGRAYVAWSANTFGESGTTSRTYVAVRPAGARAFRAADLLESVRAVPSLQVYPQPLLAVAGNTALIAWTGRTGSTWQVRAAAARSDGSFGAPQTVSDPAVSTSLGAVSMLPGGTAAVALARLDDEDLPSRVFVAFRADATTGFSAPEDVGGGATRSLPLVAMDPLARQATATWTQNFGPVSNSTAKLEVRVQSATRSTP